MSFTSNSKLSSILFVLQALCGLFSEIALAKQVTYYFEATWVQAAPDGFERPVQGINGQWPNPTIEADVGDDVVVNFRNSLGDSTAGLHFHAMFQAGTAYHDGSVGVAQCPVPPGESFTYSFKPSPQGPTWYHGHDHESQYPDGLRGPMIIHDRAWEDSLNITGGQKVITLSDWYRRKHTEVSEEYLSPDNRNGRFPSPDSLLVNESSEPMTLDLEEGKRYLLRIISLSAVACSNFHIDGVQLEVVGVDGTHTEPALTDTLRVCAGQRYDVIVERPATDEEVVETSWIAQMETDMLNDNIPSDEKRSVIGTARWQPGQQSGSFHLRRGQLDNNGNEDTNARVERRSDENGTDNGTDNGTSVTITPSWNPGSGSVLDDMTLRPLSGHALYGPVDRTIFFRTNQTYIDGVGTRIALGEQPWVSPKVPTLLSVMSTGEAANNETTYGPGVEPYVLEPNKVIQIIMENPQPFGHPMHLHGHEFQIVARGQGSWDGVEENLPATPVTRDTATVPGNGYLVVRFVTDNPGVWQFHCHIDLHLLAGMAATFIESPMLLQQQQTLPPHAHAICAAAGLPSEGNCAGTEGEISAEDAAAHCNDVHDQAH